jgi:hypothetical protein
MSRNILKEQSLKERGAALAEAAIVIPLIAIIMIGMSDLCRMLHQYSYLASVAREGARTASRIIDLEVGHTSSAVDFRFSTPTYDSNAHLTSHNLVHDRVQYLLWLNQRNNELRMNGINVATDYFASTGPSAASNDTINVRIEARYDSLFPWLDGFRFRVEASAPYLAPDSTS